MKLSSLFRFKRKNFDILLLIKDIFKTVESSLASEFQDSTYQWNKSKNIKQYECFVFARFLIDYSFSVSYKDVDKNAINSFNKISEEVFVELHDEKYSNIFSYKDLKSTINEKYNVFTALRKENKPPECWHMIYSLLTGKDTVKEIESEVAGLKKAIKSLNKISKLNNLIVKFQNRIDDKNNEIASFDLAEILFRRNIRSIKKQLITVNIPNYLKPKK